ncbi:MAG: type II secretion system protein, partial [bacterium]|nr:type II secretion system protein [bacterium]
MGFIRSRRSHYSLFTIHYSRERRAFTLFELIVVVGIFIVMSGMLLANFRRSRVNDVVRIAALRFASDVQRMQSNALSGATESSGAVAYGVHVDKANPRRYIMFGDRVRCAPDAQGEEVCAANGIYDAGVTPAEELSGGTVS